MRFQDQIVKMTQRALDDLSRAALALPEAHIAWSPGGEARPAISQLKELALSASWILPIIEVGSSQKFDSHPTREKEGLPETPDLTTVATCLAEAKRSTSILCKAITKISDDRLEDEVTLPFLGGTVMTVADLLTMHYWNLTYHLGQINQIGLILGDKEMH